MCVSARTRSGEEGVRAHSKPMTPMTTNLLCHGKILAVLRKDPNQMRAYLINYQERHNGRGRRSSKHQWNFCTLLAPSLPLSHTHTLSHAHVSAGKLNNRSQIRAQRPSAWRHDTHTLIVLQPAPTSISTTLRTRHGRHVQERAMLSAGLKDVHHMT